MKHWLLKTEPESFSIDDLSRAPKQTTSWDGVRNYQARNFMRTMEIGDQAFFYHSNGDPPCLMGVVEVVKKAYPDHTSLDPDDHHYDPKSTPDNPIWEMVDVRLVRKFERPISLGELREIAGLESMELLRKGSRLSVQPVSAAEWKIVMKIAGKYTKGK